MTARTLMTSLCAGLVIGAACSAPPPPAASTLATKRVDAATAGSITGRVTFAGTPPANDPLRMGGDRACAQSAGPNPMNDAVLIGSDGAVENTFVYLKSGLDPAYTFDAPSGPVELDQRGCRYLPRVLGVRVGQTLEVMNNDDTLHNVHGLPTANQEFNQGLQSRGSRMQKTFTVPEVMVRFKCDVHGWMSAWVGVVAHPYFAVTKADGSFDFRGVPPGTYVVEAWHEKLGTQTSTVTIGDKQAQTVAFQFGAGAGK